MATVNDIYRFLDQKAPFRYQADFDNAGFLVGRTEQSVKKIMIALDITQEVISEAIENRCQLIISHHPVIWGKIGQVTDETTTGKILLMLIQHDISAICAHTNLDAVEGGVNSVLAERIGILEPYPLEADGIDETGTVYGIGRAGYLQSAPISLEQFVSHVKASLNLTGIRVLDAGSPVEKVAVGGGACGSMLPLVKAQGCDTFVTSDLKHDLYLEARALGINLLDAGHYSTETVICPTLARWISEEFPTVEVLLSSSEREVFAYL